MDITQKGAETGVKPQKKKMKTMLQNSLLKAVGMYIVSFMVVKGRSNVITLPTG